MNAIETLREMHVQVNLKKHLKRVSIDQCFFRDILKNEPGHIEFKEAVIRAISRDKLHCPVHREESIFESSLLPVEMRGRVFELQASFAKGFRFWSFMERLELEILEFITGQTSPSLVSCEFSPDPDQVQGLIDSNRRAKEEYRDRLNDLGATPEKPFDKIVSEINAAREADFVRVLRAMLLNEPTPKDAWDYALGLGMQINHFEPGDLKRVLNWAGDGNWIKSPYLTVHTKLWAVLESRKKVSPNDQLDILRLSVAFVDADVIFCDNPMEAAVRQSKLDRQFSGVRVFGNRDLKEGIAYLNSL